MTAALGRPRLAGPRDAWQAPGAGLPGLALPGRLPGRLPRDLLAPGVLMLAGVDPGVPIRIERHFSTWGPAPTMGLVELIDRVGAHGIVGAGGAAFPTDRKLASLAGRRVSRVIVNGAEGETASGKDGVLLTHVPHLVLDGAVACARALAAPQVTVRISVDRPELAASLANALSERHDVIPIEVSLGPATFVAGEATSILRSLAGGPALPAELGRPPVIPTRWPRRPSHALLSNVETFARIALAVRGIPGSSALASASGAVRTPGVVELGPTATVSDVAAAAGGPVGAPTVLITGGWHGRWVPWDDLSAGTRLTRDALTDLGGRWGAGAFLWLPADLDPWVALEAIAGELAASTAGQCGPCVHGLPSAVEMVGRMATGAAGRAEADALMAMVEGRGICAHPTAAVAALRSAMDLLGGAR